MPSSTAPDHLDDRPRSGVYRRADGRWEWRIVAPSNGRIVATSHDQGFENEADAQDMFVTVAAGGFISEVAAVVIMVDDRDRRRHLLAELDRARRTPPPGRPA